MGSIYKLSDGEKDYYGSTTMPLEIRIVRHTSPANDTSSNILNRDNLTIELMEEVEDESQLLIREQYYLDNYECVNKNRAYLNPEHKKQYQQEYYKHYRVVNRDKQNKYQKQYQETNRDKINEKARTKYRCECGADVSHSHKARHEKSPKHINKIG